LITPGAAASAVSQGAAPGPVLQPHQLFWAVTVVAWISLYSPLLDGSDVAVLFTILELTMMTLELPT
jgi:hypothetical protein